MNYFAHALPFLDAPYFAAGTAVPDWLSVVDRRVRLRQRHLEGFLEDQDSLLASLAGGVRQHLADDDDFHRTPAFSQALGEMTQLVRSVLDGDTRVPTQFLAHLLIEVLLDADLVARFPQQTEVYYRLMDSVDSARIEAAVATMAPRPAAGLGEFVEHFARARILWDYLEDDKLFTRLNQVMRRLGLEDLPPRCTAVLPRARRVVSQSSEALMAGTAVGAHLAGRSPPHSTASQPSSVNHTTEGAPRCDSV